MRSDREFCGCKELRRSLSSTGVQGKDLIHFKAQHRQQRIATTISKDFLARISLIFIFLFLFISRAPLSSSWQPQWCSNGRCLNKFNSASPPPTFSSYQADLMRGKNSQEFPLNCSLPPFTLSLFKFQRKFSLKSLCPFCLFYFIYMIQLKPKINCCHFRSQLERTAFSSTWWSTTLVDQRWPDKGSRECVEQADDHLPGKQGLWNPLQLASHVRPWQIWQEPPTWCAEKEHAGSQWQPQHHW